MTPLERAARALAGWTPNMVSWEGMVDDPKDAPAIHAHYLEQVRAVLQAIREPSEGMVKAGFEDYPAIWTAALTPEDRIGIYQAMIDEALKEPT